ncbi:hypothetical protein [Streptomyces sp. NPDC088794]|uniref:hypothetical protein n=1 Tax=Streptomyces sp. NPDC088794 TaxID=3365902 RepID=UPI00380C183C
MRLKYAGTLFIRYTGALLPGHAPPAVQSPGSALNLPQRHLPARHAFLAALSRHRAAAATFAPPSTDHTDDALRPCPTSRA